MVGARGFSLDGRGWWTGGLMSKFSDCIVIGGGVVGLTTARRLAREGLEITLLERSQCGREASWAGAGIIAPPNPHRNDELSELQYRSVAMYPDLCAALHDEAGIDPEYDRCGELQLHRTEDTWGIAKSYVRATEDRTTPEGMPIYALHAPEALGQVEAVLTREVVGVLECRLTAQVRNPRLLAALRTACVNAGVNIREHTAVDDIIVEGAQITGVRAGSETLSAGTVILCAGAWSSLIGDRLATLMPVYPVRGQVVLMALDDRPFTRIISSGKTYLVPRKDGHLLLGSTEEPEAGYEKRNTPEGVSWLIQAALDMVPMLADAPVQATWSGLRPGTPDDLPYLGPVPGLGGLIAATGHFRAGLTLAPATAEVVWHAVNQRPFDIDLTCCLPGRT
jgi:glycine oxidase